MGSRARPTKTWSMPPPDENTVVDPTGAAWVVWLVIVGPGLLFATVACVRRVGPGELVVVLRQGQVVRARRDGFVGRVPGLEQFETVPVGPRVLPLVIRSRTADGVDVVAMADLTLEVHGVETGAEHVPTADVVRVAEEAVEAAVAQVEVCSLVDDLADLEATWPAEVGRRLPVGTEVAALAVTEVEARLA
jgi:regulator of protease activity HflC (stomatin/prohibitin superfamily)